MATSKAECNAQAAYMKHMNISKDDIRIVLVGKSGSGKSETVNNIIGEKKFKTDMTADSVTQYCQSVTTTILGKQVTAVDTPGIFDPSVRMQDTQREIANFINMTLPGPHVILFVTEIGRITEEDKSTLQKFKEQFGDEILEHMIFVFTHYGKWKRTKKPFRDYVQSTGKSFPILKKYNDRFVAFENEENGLGEKDQVQDLMSVIQRVITANGGECYTNEMYKARLSEIDEERRQKEREEQTRLEKEQEKMRKKEKVIEEKTRKSASERSRKEKYKLMKRVQQLEEEQKAAAMEKKALQETEEAEERGRKQAEAIFEAKLSRERKERKEEERWKKEKSERKQMEKVGIELEQLVLSTDYLVFCGIQIKNNTKYELFAPDIKTTQGSVMLPPRGIGPHEAGIVVTHKFPYSVLGSMGGVSWNFRYGVFASKLFVRWSIPFILDSASSNRMDVGFTEVEDPNWYSDIMHTNTHRHRGGVIMDSSTYHFGKFHLSGSMASGQRTIITLSLSASAR